MMSHGVDDEDIADRLYWAASDGNVGAIDKVLALGVDVNAVSATTGMTALHAAAAKANYTAVVHLLNNGADPTLKNSYGVTPLHAACRGGARQVVIKLLDAGADSAAKDDAGKTASDVAIEAGNTSIAALMNQRALAALVGGGKKKLAEGGISGGDDDTLASGAAGGAGVKGGSGGANRFDARDLAEHLMGYIRAELAETTYKLEHQLLQMEERLNKRLSVADDRVKSVEESLRQVKSGVSDATKAATAANRFQRRALPQLADYTARTLVLADQAREQAEGANHASQLARDRAEKAASFSSRAQSHAERAERAAIASLHAAQGAHTSANATRSALAADARSRRAAASAATAAAANSSRESASGSSRTTRSVSASAAHEGSPGNSDAAAPAQPSPSPPLPPDDLHIDIDVAGAVPPQGLVAPPKAADITDDEAANRLMELAASVGITSDKGRSSGSTAAPSGLERKEASPRASLMDVAARGGAAMSPVATGSKRRTKQAKSLGLAAQPARQVPSGSTGSSEGAKLAARRGSGGSTGAPVPSPLISAVQTSRVPPRLSGSSDELDPTSPAMFKPSVPGSTRERLRRLLQTNAHPARQMSTAQAPAQGRMHTRGPRSHGRAAHASTKMTKHERSRQLAAGVSSASAAALGDGGRARGESMSLSDDETLHVGARGAVRHLRTPSDPELKEPVAVPESVTQSDDEGNVAGRGARRRTMADADARDRPAAALPAATTETAGSPGNGAEPDAPVVVEPAGVEKVVNGTESGPNDAAGAASDHADEAVLSSVTVPKKPEAASDQASKITSSSLPAEAPFLEQAHSDSGVRRRSDGVVAERAAVADAADDAAASGEEVKPMLDLDMEARIERLLGGDVRTLARSAFDGGAASPQRAMSRDGATAGRRRRRRKPRGVSEDGADASSAVTPEARDRLIEHLSNCGF